MQTELVKNHLWVPYFISNSFRDKTFDLKVGYVPFGGQKEQVYVYYIDKNEV